MNRWVVICEGKTFPFSASTPFPAVGVCSPPAIAFLSQSLSSSFCLQSLAGVLPMGSKCWSKAGTSVQIPYLSDCILRYSEWPVPGWPFPLYCCRCPAAGGLQECFCFREFFFTCHLQILLSPTQSDFPHREVAGSKVLYTMKYLH